MDIAASLKAAQKQYRGECPNISAVSRLCHVSWHFVHMIENEIDQHDRVLLPTVKIMQQVDFGPGSKTLDE
jgi:hypothetical protein